MEVVPSLPVPLILLIVASLPFCPLTHCRLFSPSVPFLRSAPQMCPIDDGNLVDVKLFIASDQECFRLCERAPECSFFRYEQQEPSMPTIVSCIVSLSYSIRFGKISITITVRLGNLIAVKLLFSPNNSSGF